MKTYRFSLMPLALAGTILLSGCGGEVSDEDPLAEIKSGCIAHFKEQRPQFPDEVIAFDAWNKDSKVVVEFGTEKETGQGKKKATARTIVDQCYYDSETEIYRLPSPFESVTSRNGNPVQRDTRGAKSTAGAE